MSQDKKPNGPLRIPNAAQLRELIEDGERLMRECQANPYYRRTPAATRDFYIEAIRKITDEHMKRLPPEVRKLEEDHAKALSEIPGLVSFEQVYIDSDEDEAPDEVPSPIPEAAKPSIPPGQFMDWFARACFMEKYDAVFEPLIVDYRYEVQLAREAGYTRLTLAKLHFAYWTGFIKACGFFSMVERVAKYFTARSD